MESRAQVESCSTLLWSVWLGQCKNPGESTGGSAKKKVEDGGEKED